MKIVDAELFTWLTVAYDSHSVHSLIKITCLMYSAKQQVFGTLFLLPKDRAKLGTIDCMQKGLFRLFKKLSAKYQEHLLTLTYICFCFLFRNNWKVASINHEFNIC